MREIPASYSLLLMRVGASTLKSDGGNYLANFRIFLTDLTDSNFFAHVKVFCYFCGKISKVKLSKQIDDR